MARTSKSSSELKPGYMFCPHCDGWTICECGTCGTKMHRDYRGKPYEYIEKGICKVCNGLGQVPK